MAQPDTHNSKSRIIVAEISFAEMAGQSRSIDQPTSGPAADVAHLNARDTTLVFASRAPQKDIERLKARMGWKMPWYTITDSFDSDFGVHEWHGTNAFIRDDDQVFRTYFIDARGDEQMGNTWNYLDITALGRQEEWEDSPQGYPQTKPYKRWKWHDAYNETGRPLN
jgi:predicted dithiol-disulfide oxidoreductase (DUF899 family)